MLRLGEQTPEGLSCVGFNQDGTCIASSGKGGVRIYSCEDHATCFELKIHRVYCVSMLYSTSLLAFTGSEDLSPRQVIVFNTHTKATVAKLAFPSAVLNISMGRKFLCIVLENQIKIYEIESLQEFVSIDTELNPRGVFNLAVNSKRSWFAYPNDRVKGSVKVQDILTCKNGEEIRIDAHKSSIAQLQFNKDGSMLATASTYGTIVNIWSLPSGSKTHQLKRGNSPARITGLAFGPHGLFCVGSNHGTLHIFLLGIQSSLYDKARKALGIHELNRIMQIRQAVVHGESAAVLFKQRSDSENPNEAELLCLTSSGVLSSYLIEISTQEDSKNFKYGLLGQWKITER
eukprot:jgi/Picsp_1/3965/NSC_01477-R1_protein-vacuolar targeting protein